MINLGLGRHFLDENYCDQRTCYRTELSGITFGQLARALVDLCARAVGWAI